jgi:hypothetical protein
MNDDRRRDDRSANLAAARPLWAITSFFNPVGYARRLANYRAFRSRLMVPLVTVELARERSRFQMRPDDADILIQVTGEDLLWQKERLLNLALRALPPACREVAWLDCDIVLDDDDWPRRVGSALGQFPLVQPFARFHDLPPDAEAQDPDVRLAQRGGHSFASRLAAGTSVDDLFRNTPGAPPRGHTVGLAWAARRGLLDDHGLYDGCILGGGDRAMLIAALGRFELLAKLHMNERQTAHYLSWARPFFEAVRANIGYVDATVFHLWHGERTDRKYRRRHAEFRRFGFDPFVDIAIDAHGCWRWTTANAEMRAYLKEYFEARNEDGAKRSP